MLDTQEDVIVAASQEDALDYLMAKNIAETLHAHYPGHLWAVNVIGEHGIATIHNLMLSGQWGYRIMLDRNYSDSDLTKRVIKAGGEILERFKVKRGAYDDAQIADLPMDFAGRTIGDLAT